MEEYKSLPNMEHRFQIQIVGDKSRINWVGEFLYKRPTLGELSQIAQMKASLSGDLATIDIEYVSLNHMIAYLRYTLRDFPTWWESSNFGTGLYDFNVVDAIYDKCIEFEKEWEKKIHDGTKKANFVLTKNDDKTEEEEPESIGSDTG